MRAAYVFAAWIPLAAFAPAVLAGSRPAPQVRIVDGIVARIEDDIITLSELRELGAYQQLLDGHSQSDEELRSELIEQWIVNNEASVTRFPLPAETEVDREVARIAANFPTPAAYQQRLTAVGLTSESLRRMVTRQIHLARYIDYKFRSSIQVDDAAIAGYYRDHLVPDLQAKAQQAPPLEGLTDQIRELLVEQGVNNRAAAWFDETKSRLKIVIEPMDALSGGTPASKP
jgi:hypothetical protein